MVARAVCGSGMTLAWHLGAGREGGFPAQKASQETHC